MTNSLISIIIPVKNGANYLYEALSGIKAQKMNMEIIVVDDGSDDNTFEIAQNFADIVLKHHISKGSVVAKNTALKIATGKYIMFHDHDDVMNENALLQMYDELEKDEKISAVMAKIKDFISPEISAEERQKIVIRIEPYSGLFSGATLMRKEIFDKIGLFNENLKAGEIIDWQIKMQEQGLKIKKLDFVSANRRIHNSNFGRTNKEKEFVDYAAILRSKIKKSQN